MRRGWLILPLVALALTALSCGSDAPREASSTGGGDVLVAGGNPARNGVYPGPALDGAPKLLWKTQVSGGGLSSVVVVDGTVYALSYEGGYITALDAKTGEERWQTQIEQWLPSTLAIADGVIFVQGNDNLYALDTADGGERWRLPLKAGNNLASPVAVDGVVYTGSGDGNVYAVDASSGQERWRFRVAEQDAVFAAIADAGFAAIVDGVVYVDGEPSTWALDASTGRELWHFDKGRYTYASLLAVAQGTVFLSDVEFIYAIDAASGEAVWHARTENNPLPPPAVANGLAYFVRVDDYDRLSALDAATGELRWTVQTGDDTLTQPAVVDDELYVGGRSLYALNAETGEELWQFDLETQEPGDGSILPVPAGGVIYAAVCLDLAYESGCEEGDSYVYAIAGSGKPFEGEKRLTPQAPTGTPVAAATAASAPSVRNPNATPPVLIDSPGTWTFRDLGYADVWLDRNNGKPAISRLYADPIFYALPPGASQGPDLWYRLHLHFEVILKDNVNTADKGVQEFTVWGTTGAMGVVMVDFSSVWEGGRLVVDCGHGFPCSRTQERDGDIVTVNVEGWPYPNLIPNVGVASGVNGLMLAIPDKELPPRFQALHVFDDSFIEVSTTDTYAGVTPPSPP